MKQLVCETISVHVSPFVVPAVDLQSCGVTSTGAGCLQELVHVNRSLVVLDLRANELIGEGSSLDTHTHTQCPSHSALPSLA